MNRITNITIEKFKGIDHRNLDFTDLFANKLNLLVAPNGFGKSSLAHCFDNLIKGKLKLPDELKHSSHAGLNQKLSVTVQLGTVTKIYEADQTKNDFFKDFEIVVINSKLVSVTKQGYNFAKATSKIDHEKTLLVDSVPKKVTNPYKKSFFITKFKGCRLPIISLDESVLDNRAFMLWLLHFDFKGRLSQTTPVKKLAAFEAELLKGASNLNEATILSLISDIDIFHLIHDKYKELCKPISSLEGYTGLFQLLYLCFNNTKPFFEAINYDLYMDWRKRIKKTIDLLNSAQFEVAELNQVKSELYFSLLNFDKLSNGQRDVASFIAQLFKAEYRLLNNSSKENSILIIDEVFDYLDEANIVSCQYFISKLIDSFKDFSKNIFPLVLTHLAPAGFDSFKTHKMKCHFLLPRNNQNKNLDLRRIIISRDKYAATQSDVDLMSQFYLHFHNQDTLKIPSIGLSAAINGSASFHAIVQAHLKKYLEGNTDFDPFAICVSLRVNIEKYIYFKIHEGQTKSEFLTARGTGDKLNLAENSGVEVPEVFYLLGIIYNEALHTKEFQITFAESKIASQLQNEVISILIKETCRICGIN